MTQVRRGWRRRWRLRPRLGRGFALCYWWHSFWFFCWGSCCITCPVCPNASLLFLVDETDSSKSLVKDWLLWFGISYVIVIMYITYPWWLVYIVDEQKGMKEVKGTIYAICGISKVCESPDSFIHRKFVLLMCRNVIKVSSSIDSMYLHVLYVTEGN